jgi:predicted RNase H-like nuclease (RuvC/YqgF family)
MGESLVPIIVALLGGSSMVVAAVLTRRSGSEDRTANRQEAEVRYLSERLDKERGRTDALEDEVRACHTQRDADRVEFQRRLGAQDERIEHLTALLRRYLTPGGPDAPTA